MLDLCDELGSIKRKIQDPGLKPQTLTRLRKRSKQKLEELALDLRQSKFKGFLGTIQKELAAEHFLVLAILLRLHLRSDSPFIEGRELLSSVFETSFELLQGMELLQGDSVLSSLGLMEQEIEDEDGERLSGEDLLEARFRLCPKVLDAFLEELGIPSKSRSRTRRPYSNQNELLLDLKMLHNLHQARASRLFSVEKWSRLRGDESDRGTKAVSRRIRGLEQEIERKLQGLERPQAFPLLRFVQQMGLGTDDLLIVIHLLFLELHEGNPFEDTVVLLQLVSSSEAELLQKRALFLENSLLRRKDILEVECMVETREMTSECRLANWVLPRIFGVDRNPIDADEKLEFHLFLESLDSSTFLKDL
jgi:hypothetical protein